MIRLPSLVIDSGATESNILDGKFFRWMDQFFIYPPAAISGVVTIQIAAPRPSTVVSADFRDLESEGAVVTLTAGQALPIVSAQGFGSIRLQTTVAPGADETHEVTGHDDAGF